VLEVPTEATLHLGTTFEVRDDLAEHLRRERESDVFATDALDVVSNAGDLNPLETIRVLLTLRKGERRADGIK
jgi:hypothetical protein